MSEERIVLEAEEDINIARRMAILNVMRAMSKDRSAAEVAVMSMNPEEIQRRATEEVAYTEKGRRLNRMWDLKENPVTGHREEVVYTEKIAT